MFNKKLIIKIDGMHCEHCKKKVEENLKKIENIKKVKVILTDGLVTITYKGALDIDDIRKVIEDLDFKYNGVLV